PTSRCPISTHRLAMLPCRRPRLRSSSLRRRRGRSPIASGSRAARQGMCLAIRLPASCVSSPGRRKSGAGPVRRGSGGVAVMGERINYVWRLIGTGLAFAFFGLGGLFLTLFVFTPIALFSRDEATRIRRVRRVIYHSFRLFVFLLRAG